MKSRIRIHHILMVIFAGGVVGTLFRWGIHLTTDNYLFPYGTLIENITGSLLLGMLAGWAAVKTVPVLVKEGVGTGFCGGFTTMSTFAADTVYLQEGAGIYTASLYISLSLAGGILAASLGMILGRKIAYKKQEGVK